MLASGLLPVGLSESELAQLNTVGDGSSLYDEAALYPLLGDALSSELPDVVDHARVLSPGDYASFLAKPQSHRGELVLIEGRYAGRSRQLPLCRPDPNRWGEALTEWVVLIDPADNYQVVVVLLIDPDRSIPTPVTGQVVRIPARFYKLWGDKDLTGTWRQFITFVGRHVKLVRPDHAQPSGSEISLGRLLTVITILALIFFILRIYTVRRRRNSRVR